MKIICCSLIFLLWLNKRTVMNCDEHVKLIKTAERIFVPIIDELSKEEPSHVIKFAKNTDSAQRSMQVRNPSKQTQLLDKLITTRQFTMMKKKPTRSTVRRMFQISLLMLTIMGFGTFVMSVIMRNVRLNNTKNHSTANRVVINMLRPATGNSQKPATGDSYSKHV